MPATIWRATYAETHGPTTGDKLRLAVTELIVGALTNDIHSSEDAEYLMRVQVLPLERIRGGETRGLPAHRHPRGCLDQPGCHRRDAGRTATRCC